MKEWIEGVRPKTAGLVACCVLGVALVVTAAALIYLPVAVGLAGVAFLLAGLLIDTGDDEKKG